MNGSIPTFLRAVVLVVAAIGIIPPPLQATTYYVDATGGNDANNGTSAGSAWQTLTKVNSVEFSPGDGIRFKAGGVWNGQLKPQGSGTSSSPITIDVYDTGAKPIINGPGTNASAGVLLSGVQYWELNNLEVTNTQPSGGSNQVTGILVKGGIGFNHIYIQGCHIHDVNSALSPNINYNKGTGGILFVGDVSDVLVANCEIRNVAVEGLRTNMSKSVTKVIFADNLIDTVYGDGIVIHGSASGSKIEHNVLHNTCYNTDLANFAGVWTYDSTGTVVQRNEIYGLTGGGANDGEPFDADIDTNGDIFQYNYSHDNARGFMLFMNSAQNIIVRYNISQNDSLGLAPVAGHRLFFQDKSGSPSNHIYNNVFFSSNALDNVWFQGYNISFDNNILYFAGGASHFNTKAFSDASIFRNNCFFPASMTTVNGPGSSSSNNMSSDPQFANPGTGGTGITLGPLGFATSQNGYYLKSSSPALGKGLLISANGGHDYWGNPVSSTSAPNIGAYSPLPADRASR